MIALSVCECPCLVHHLDLLSTSTNACWYDTFRGNISAVEQPYLDRARKPKAQSSRETVPAISDLDDVTF